MNLTFHATSVDLTRIDYHRDLEREARARGDVPGERRAARNAENAEAALRNDESRWFREGPFTKRVNAWPPALRAMVFGS